MLYEQIDQAIEKHRDDALALLRELVRIPSLEGQEKPCMDVLERQLRSMGLEVDRWIHRMMTNSRRTRLLCLRGGLLCGTS